MGGLRNGLLSQFPPKGMHLSTVSLNDFGRPIDARLSGPTRDSVAAFRLAIARAADGLVVSKLWRQEPSESELIDAIVEGVSLLRPEDDAPLSISASVALRQVPALQALQAAMTITRLRGRDPQAGQTRNSRGPHNAPKNTHAGPVDEADPLDLVLDSIAERKHEHVYDYIVLSLVDIFRAWETATTVAERVALQLRAVRWTLEELIAVREVAPLLPMQQSLSMLSGEFGYGGVWKRQLYQWLAETFAGGLMINGERIQSYWLKVALVAENESLKAPGIRRLPQLPALLACLGVRGRVSRIHIDLSRPFAKRPNEGDRRGMVDEAVGGSVYTALMALSAGHTDRYVGTTGRHSKASVLGSECEAGARSEDWWFPVATQGLPLPTLQASRDVLSNWVSTANTELARWGAGTRVASAEIRAGNTIVPFGHRTLPR